MIKFIKRLSSGKTLIGFGISEENVKRLKQGQPILIKLKDEMGIAFDANVLIFYGETEDAMAETLAPYIVPDTEKRDKRN